MPPLTKQQKLEAMEKTQTLLNLIGRTYTPAEKEAILADDERYKTTELARKYVSFRDDGIKLFDKYDISVPAPFRRAAQLFLDNSGTAEADRRNREFLNGLNTPEGKKKFTDGIVSELLAFDPADWFLRGSTEENIRHYAAHARTLELGWVAGDFIGKNGEGLYDEQTNAVLIDRRKLFQQGGDFVYFLRAAANDSYQFMPELSSDELTALGGYDYEEYVPDKQFADAAEHYFGDIQACISYTSPEEKKKYEIGRRLASENKLSYHSVAKDENGNRIDLFAAINESAKGKTVTFESDPGVKAALRPLIGGAVLPIEKPAKGTAVYDAFGDEALAARGKGLQKEFTRLSAVMDGAKLWYTGGSPEFRAINRLLRETAAGSPPNTEESVDVMQQILGNCEKYLRDKDKLLSETGAARKEREQKRYDAVRTVRDDLLKKVNFLKIGHIRADAKHFEAEIGAGDMGRVFHVNEENQRNFESESHKKAKEYRNILAGLKKEGGAVALLAEKADATVEKLAAYADSSPKAFPKPEFLTDGSLSVSVAEMSLLEIVRGERASLAGRGSATVKGDAERMLDSIVKNGETWDRAVAKVAGMDTVKKLIEDIGESPRGAADYLVANGSGAVLGDLRRELAAANRQTGAEKDAPVIEVPEKKAPSLNGPAAGLSL